MRNKITPKVAKKISKSLEDFFADRKPLRVTYSDKQGNVVTRMMTNSELKKLRKKK